MMKDKHELALITDQSVNIFFIVSQRKAINELSNFQRCDSLMGDMLRLNRVLFASRDLG